MNGWQPMDSAPQDGSIVLIVFSEYVGAKPTVSAGYYDNGLDCDGDPYEDPAWYWFDNECTGPVEPVRWQPMPAPPGPEALS